MGFGDAFGVNGTALLGERSLPSVRDDRGGVDLFRSCVRGSGSRLLRRSSSQRRVGGVVVDSCGLYGRYGRIALTRFMSFCESEPKAVWGSRRRVERVLSMGSIQQLAFHSGSASARMSSRIHWCRALSLTTSTLHPSSSSRSCHRAVWSRRLRPASISIRKSMSLFGPHSPFATLPKTQIFLAPCSAAILKISLRLASMSALAFMCKFPDYESTRRLLSQRLGG